MVICPVTLGTKLSIFIVQISQEIELFDLVELYLEDALEMAVHW